MLYITLNNKLHPIHGIYFIPQGIMHIRNQDFFPGKMGRVCASFKT